MARRIFKLFLLLIIPWSTAYSAWQFDHDFGGQNNGISIIQINTDDIPFLTNEYISQQVESNLNQLGITLPDTQHFNVSPSTYRFSRMNKVRASAKTANGIWLVTRQQLIFGTEQQQRFTIQTIATPNIMPGYDYGAEFVTLLTDGTGNIYPVMGLFVDLPNRQVAYQLIISRILDVP